MNAAFADHLIRRVPVVCGSVVASAGLVRCFWGRDLTAAISLTMAVGYVLLGTALVLFSLRPPFYRLIGRGLAATGLILGLLGLTESGVPGLFAGELAEAVQRLPGTLSLRDSMAFILGSLALFSTRETAGRQRRAWSPWLVTGLISLVLVSLLTGLFTATTVGLAGPVPRMEWLPASGLLLLGVGLGLLRPEDDFVGVLLGAGVTGLLARRLLLAAVALPPLLVLACLQMPQTRGFAASESLAVFTVIYMLAGMGWALWAARIAGAFQHQRAQAEEERDRLLARLQTKAADLQEAVAARTHEVELASHVEQMALIGGWEYDLRLPIVYWSPGMRQLHEVSATYQPDIESSHSFCAPEMRGVLQDAHQRCLTQGEPYDLELPLVTATGRRRWVRMLGRAEKHEGRIVRLYGACQDITQRNQAEETRRQLELRLFQAQKMETLGTLAGGIAHDFNNLLTGIMGYHDLATDLLPEDHPVRGYLAESRTASLRARGLIEQILTFSRQQVSADRMPLDVGLLVGEAQRFLRATLPATIDLQTEIEADCPRVLADNTQLHQVLLNLGSNAAHAMRERGGVLKITLRTLEMDADRSAALGGLTPGRYVCISVMDTGHGMDEATVKRIFDPFFTTKEPNEGTGLGLSVVHGIVRNHQGGIEVESVVGVGTTLRIFLPAAAAENPVQARPPVAVLPGRGGTVFLVDDEEIVSKFAKMALQRFGYKVTVFTSALPCLEAVRANPQACDVVITDQTMAGLTGTDLIEAVRKINPGLRTVLMSGFFTKESTASLDQLQDVEQLNKPFTTDELVLAVQRAMQGPADQVASPS